MSTSMMISSSAAIFLSILLLFVPTIMLARHVGLAPHTSYHGDDGDQGGHGNHTTCRNTTDPSIVVKGNNNSGRRENSTNVTSNISENNSKIMEHRPLEVGAGSRLPDCSHACGSCTPCRLAVVSFLCTTSFTESETCPISYKCICNGKSYPVP